MAQPLASLDTPVGWEESTRYLRNRLFWETLTTYCAKAKFLRPHGSKVRVLDLCCGTAEEASVLCAFFSSGTPDLPNDQVEFFGVDAEASAIAKAQEIFTVPAMGTVPLTVVPTGKFLVADATRLSELTALPAEFEFILIRHQFVARDKEESTDVWTKIFAEALQKLSPQGLMLLTSFSQIEHQWCEALLRKIPARIVFSEENPHQINLQPGQDIAGDKFVIGIKRAGGQPR